MARMRSERTIYDLQAWELVVNHPELVLMITETNGTLLAIDITHKVSFKPRDLGEDYIYTIVPFAHWLAGFNQFHNVKCDTWNDVLDYYRKEGAKLW